MTDEQNAPSIAATLAEYLADRDDVASAAVIDGADEMRAEVGVETQAGELYVVTVTPA